MRFIFSNCSSLESKAIQWFEGSRFSHCAVILPDSSVVEALWDGGVQVNKLVDFLEDSDQWVIFDVKVPDEGNAEAFLMSQVGKPYDKSAIWGIALARDWDENDAWYCSELCCATLKAGGIYLDGTAEYHRVGVRLALEFINGLKQGQAVKPFIPANDMHWD